LGAKLELRAEQKLILSPMLQHALKVLQLPAMELNSLIREELAENPMLEEKESAESAGEEVSPETETDLPGSSPEQTSEVQADAEGLTPDGFDSEAWEQYFSDDDYALPKFEREPSREVTELQVTRPPTLEEHLLWQLRLVASSEEEFRLGEWIIGNLDERGFLTVPLPEIAAQAQASEESVAEALATVQGLEPTGIGARDVVESLLLQLRNLTERNPLAERIVEKHFEDMEKRQFERISRAEKVPREEVLAAFQVITGLDPFPGRHQFTEAVEYVVPDVIVEKHDDQYLILVNDDGLPELKVSRTYRQLLRQRKELGAETRKYLEEKLQRAVWLMRSIEQRRKTLYRVTETIVDVQREFFEKGVEYLKPLTLREIANRLNLHESTISRVTSNKYAQTPRGVFELKYFFSHQVMTTGGGQISATAVKAVLADLIAQEDSRRPLSDQRLTELLLQRGFQIARRTVAKYREELNLLPASQRRRLA